MGVEIAKVSLWLSTFVPGFSLAYLDHNVQRGNALIGVASPEEVTASSLFANILTGRLAEAANAAAALQAIDDTTPEQVAASRAADAALDERVAGARRLFDLWTAEPFGVSGARDEAGLRGGELIEGAHTPLTDAAGELADQEHFLHWPLAFAEVFAHDRPGFDAVVGNPPWEEVTVERPSFFARYQPGIRRGTTEAEREDAIAELIVQRPELADLYEAEATSSLRYRRYFRLSGQYPSMPGDPDLYKLFCQRYRGLLRECGGLGIVLPRTAFVNLGSSDFREWLMTKVRAKRVDFIRNRRKWAFDIHAQKSIALVLAERDLPKDDAQVEFCGPADSAEAFRLQLARPGLRLSKQAFGPAWAPPFLETQPQCDLLESMREQGTKFPLGGGRWTAFPVAELHERNDRIFWERDGGALPMWKGESYESYVPKGSSARLCTDSEELRARIDKPKPGMKSLLKSVPLETRRKAVRRELARARVSFSDITQSNNSRTVVACLVPRGILLGNTAPYLAFVDGTELEQAACLGVLNSLPFDWQTRRFADNHMNFFILEGLCVPRVSDLQFKSVALAAARLSCPDERFSDFAAATGVEVGRLDDATRISLRADIDAHIAHAWKLEAADLETIFADFTTAAVTPAYRELVRTRFAALA